VSNETLFFVCGIALAVSAVLISLIGLKVKDFPGRAFPLVILWFAILVGSATTFAVLHAKDEEKAKAAEFEKAGKEFEAQGNDAAPGAKSEPVEETAKEGTAHASEPKAAGPGGTLQLAADPSAIAFDKTSLTASPARSRSTSITRPRSNTTSRSSRTARRSPSPS